MIPAGEATELSDEQLAAWVIARAAQKPDRVQQIRHLAREVVLRLRFVGNCIRLRSISRAKWVLDFDRNLE